MSYIIFTHQVCRSDNRVWIILHWVFIPRFGLQSFDTLGWQEIAKATEGAVRLLGNSKIKTYRAVSRDWSFRQSTAWEDVIPAHGELIRGHCEEWACSSQERQLIKTKILDRNLHDQHSTCILVTNAQWNYGIRGPCLNLLMRSPVPPVYIFTPESRIKGKSIPWKGTRLLNLLIFSAVDFCLVRIKMCNYENDTEY